MKNLTTYKNIAIFVANFILILYANYSTAQSNSAQAFDKDIPVLAFSRPDLTEIQQEDIVRDNNGEMYRFAIGTGVNVSTENSGRWISNHRDEKIWQLVVKYPGAQALSFYFSKFYLYGNATINVYNVNRERLHPTYTANEVLEHGRQNIALCTGDYMLIELVEPKGTQSSIIEIEGISYAYRSVGQSEAKGYRDSDDCEVNVNCSEGDNWQNEKQGVAHMLIKFDLWSQSWCSGSLVNNTLMDCRPYFLTAMHCINGLTSSQLADIRFYFNYETDGCSTPWFQGGIKNDYITGCIVLASSNDVFSNGIMNKSDFALLFLGPVSDTDRTQTIAKLKTFGAYWNGWDANNVAPNQGVCIHHPAGDAKKISTYNKTATSDKWSNPNPVTHWRVQFATTANGHGVTEGGSSGSPLFVYNNGNPRIVGTLSGGNDACDNKLGVSKFGKFSYHWESAGSEQKMKLQPYLNPGNTAKVVDGSYKPCETFTDFTANKTSIDVGEVITFTNMSSSSAYEWSLTITPSTGWTYTNGTSATSKNPHVKFNKVGSYTIKLTAAHITMLNPISKTKANYILVGNKPSNNCSATSLKCDEYIANVELNTIDNDSYCDNYKDYTNLSTALLMGHTYQTLVTTQVVNNILGSGYTGDQVAVWIDWNNNGNFLDPGEHIGTWQYSVGYIGGFPFTVPTNINSGTARMRVRIDYIEDGQQITPCGLSEYGEIEDYTIIIIDPNEPLPSSSINDNFLNELTAFPNPTDHKITINLPISTETINISLIDLLGKQILNTTNYNTDTVELDLSTFSEGIYQLIVTTPNGQVIRKITKQ